MLRALWFLLQIVLVVLVAVWLIEQPGDITLDAFGYTATIQTGLFLILFILAATIFAWLARVVMAILSLPAWLAGWRGRRRKARAMRNLTQGYAALAAGQADRALKLARRAKDALPELQAMALLLEAQASRATGQEAAASAAYQQLMDNKDSVFLGLKGLLSQSIAHGQTEQALEYANRAARMHPKAGWVVRTLYDLQIESRDFDEATRTLRKAVKLGEIDKAQAVSDDIAMLMYRAEKADEAGRADEAFRLTERAVKLDNTFVPAVTAYAKMLIDKGRNRKAQSLIETAWKANPHPELVTLWERLAPANTSRDMVRRMRWYESLVALNTSSAHGQLAAARAAMEDGLMGEARAYLVRAEQLQPSADLYRQFLALERAVNADESRIRELEEKLFHAPPQPVWTCTRTGTVYERWAPIARPHGSFNTIIWSLPRLSRQTAGPSLTAARDTLDDPLMLGSF